MRFTTHTGLKLTTFEIHHGTKQKTELTNLYKDVKLCLSDWSEISVSAEKKPKFPIYVTRDEEGNFSNHSVIAKTKTEEKAAEKIPKRERNLRLVSIPLKMLEKT